ncbi:MAG: response regulator, partial [Bauldia sp.]|nr:response regulator [Bauldia sp.]
AQLRPDVAIVDMSLERGSGLGAVKLLVAEHPGLRVLVFTMHDEMLYAERAMRAGDEARAEALYREVLPALVFVMAGIEHFVLYGKWLAALRLGLAPSGRRLPSDTPDPRGAAWVARFAGALGPLPT